MYKLRDWIDIKKLDWSCLSENPCDGAIELLEKNQDKIYWNNLSENSNAIHLLEQNKDKIDWDYLSENSSEGAIFLLEKNQDKIYWDGLSKIQTIVELDYNALKKRCGVFKEKLIQIALHPNRILKYLEQGYDIDDIYNFI